MSFAFAKLCWLSLRSGVSCVEKNPQAQNGLHSLLQKSLLRANHPEQVSTRPDSLQWYLLSSPPLLLAITWLGLASNLRWKCVKERVSKNWIAEGTKRKKSRLPLVYVHLSAEIRRRSRCWHSARLVRAQRTGGRYGGRSCSFLCFFFVCLYAPLLSSYRGRHITFRGMRRAWLSSRGFVVEGRSLFISRYFFFLDPTLTAFSVRFLICVNRCWISHMKTKTNKSDRCLRLSCASVRLLFFANDDVHKNVALIRDVKGSRPENRAVSLSYRGELLRWIRTVNLQGSAP